MFGFLLKPQKFDAFWWWGSKIRNKKFDKNWRTVLTDTEKEKEGFVCSTPGPK